MTQAAARDRSRLPPGQVLTNGWPILHAGTVPQISKETWDLTVHGEVQKKLTLDYAQLVNLKKTSLVCDIHCVTSWSKFDVGWEGVRFRDLMELSGPKENAHFAVLECEHGFTTSLPLDVLCDDDVLVAYRVMGADIPLEHGGPVRLLVPKRYFYKSAKWLRGIKLVEKDEPGFWEVRGYSNTADPWNEERYAGASYTEIVLNRLKAYGRRK